MPFPKIDYPTISITIPSTKKSYLFRPMLVKEEKLLLMAKSSEEKSDILGAIKQVVNNCSVDPTFKVDSLPLYCLEYVFVKLRGFSIGDNIKVSYRDFEDNKVYDFEINLKNINYRDENPIDKKIPITESAGIIMKYPSASIYDDKKFLKTEGDDSYYSLIVRCIDQVYDKENVYESKDIPESELLEFIEKLDMKCFERIRDFMSNMPSLYYKIDYKNSLGNDRVIELTSLSDFFTLR